MEMIKLWSKMAEVTVSMVWMMVGEVKETRRGSSESRTFWIENNNARGTDAVMTEAAMIQMMSKRVRISFRC